MKTLIQSVKGTREFYPKEMAVRRWLYAVIEETSLSFGYQEFEAPFIEKIDLYAAKSGEELVKEQAFVFADRGGDLVTLRPELTPSLARMVAKKQNELVYPLRWWSFGPFWRYEKPQKGRSREFFQWNIDMIGVNSPEADAELLAVCATFLKNSGVKPNQISIVINHRKLMENQLAELLISPEMNKKVFQLIDRKDKMPIEAWEANAKEMGLTPVQFSGLNEILTNENLWTKSTELVKIFSILDGIGVRDYVKFDPRIIRGLDYYTGLVFEAWDIGGDGRAVLGGGHYDNLVGDVGGDPLPGVGFAMGDVMITILLEKYGCIPLLEPFKDNILVTIFNEELIRSSIKFSASLRALGYKVICSPEVTKLQKQLKFADKLGIRLAVVIGPEEESNGEVTIKDLFLHTQVTVKRTKVKTMIDEMLATPARV